jgi:hypothetical protein
MYDGEVTGSQNKTCISAIYFYGKTFEMIDLVINLV